MESAVLPSRNLFGEEDNALVKSSHERIKFFYTESELLGAEENELTNVMTNITYWFFCYKKSFAIQGSAGTGKTTLIKKIISSHYNKSIYLCAPTHKAVSQFGEFKELLNEKRLSMCKIDKGTLQKGLGLKVETDDKGDIVYSITGQGKISQKKYDYIIVDEASMVSKEQYYALLSFDIPILWIGDKNQLPPVSNEEDSFSVYNFFSDEETYYMKNKKRFKNERFKELVKEVEAAIEKDEVFENKFLEWVINYNDVIKGWAKMPADLENNIYYIDYTNKGGLYYWLSKKQHYYVLGEKYYAKGEVKNIDKTKKYIAKEIEEELFIPYKDKKVKIKKIKFEIEGEPESKNISLWVYNPNEEDIIKEIKRKIRLMKKKHSMVMDMFSDLSPLCMEEVGINEKDYNKIKDAVMLFPESIYTVHASQGSTFENALINIGSFKYVKKKEKESNAEKMKLFYVAITRVRSCVYYKM